MTADPGVAGKMSFGVAGWSYDDWQGFVYPPGTGDQLRYIAGYVDMLEVNSTFYRPPNPRMAASWLRRTSDYRDFFFTAKLHQDVTHRAVITPEMATGFREGLRPLTEAGKLRHLLAQFRYDCADTPATRDHLSRIKDSFGDMTNLTLELRHNSWQQSDALEFLRSLGVTVANLDYPTARDSFNMRNSGIGEHAYLRLHGRNAKAWFSKAGRDETYNYLYSGSELDDIVDRAVELAEMSTTLTLVANNHYQGKEAVNILEIKARATGKKVPVPPPLAEKYPRLKDIADLLPPFQGEQGNLG